MINAHVARATMLVRQMSRQLSASMEPLSAKVARIIKELGLPESLSTAQAIQQANEQLGLEHAAGTSLVQQANAIIAELGVGPEAPVVVEGVAVGASVATGTIAPPERSSGTGAPPPTEGRVPAVPMCYRRASTERALSTRNQMMWVCWWNVAVVVLSLLALWFNVVVEHNVTGTFVPPPPSPPPPPQAPTSCPFHVAACNRKCALMHLDCRESTKKKPMQKCNSAHGEETAAGSTAAFDNFADKRRHLKSLDWEHEPSLWGLRKEKIGDGTCDRPGCGATLCECNYDGGDCAEGAAPDGGTPVYIYLMPLAILIYLGTMYFYLNKVIGYHLKAPKLRDEGELTAYVTRMQKAQVQVRFSVVCSHTTGTRTKTSHTGTNKTVVTHRSSHPFAYAASTDASTLTMDWQQPAYGGEAGSLGTDVAIVSSGLLWFAAKGVTADKLMAEKKRLYEENKHRDKDCSVSVKAALPDRLPYQLYVPAGAKFTKRLPLIAELLLVFFGLGAPLFFYYKRRLRRCVELTVRKTIFIEGHGPSADTTHV